MISDDFRTHMFSSVTHLLTTRRMFLRLFVVKRFFSFKTTDFKPLKHKQQSYKRARLFLCVRSAFSFLPTLNNYINTLICVRIPVFASILKHSDLGLKRE